MSLASDKAREKASRYLDESLYWQGQDAATRSWFLDTLARIIELEREDCAAIAERWYSLGHIDLRDQNVESYTRQGIARQIRIS